MGLRWCCAPVWLPKPATSLVCYSLPLPRASGTCTAPPHPAHFKALPEEEWQIACSGRYSKILVMGLRNVFSIISTDFGFSVLIYSFIFFPRHTFLSCLGANLSGVLVFSLEQNVFFIGFSFTSFTGCTSDTSSASLAYLHFFSGTCFHVKALFLSTGQQSCRQNCKASCQGILVLFYLLLLDYSDLMKSRRDYLRGHP